MHGGFPVEPTAQRKRFLEHYRTTHNPTRYRPIRTRDPESRAGSSVVVGRPASIDNYCIGIRYRDGVRNWPLVD